jgi:hypothetical protein
MDFRAYEAAPGISVIVLPDSPAFTHVAISNDFIRVSKMRREDVIGKGHFEVFPKSPDDPNFTGEQNLRASFNYIIEYKKPHEIQVQRYDIPNGDGSFSQRYWKINNAPLLSEANEVLYIIHTALDITEQVKAEQKVAAIKGIEKAYNLFMNAPVIIGIVSGNNYVIELANEGMLNVWGKDKEVVGKPLLEAVPELKDQGFIEILDEVRKTGKPFHAFESPSKLSRNGKEEILYFDFVYQPYYEDGANGLATGVIGVAHDVTEQVLTRKQIAEVTEHMNFRNALLEAQNEATPDGMLIVDINGKMLLHNKRFAEIWQMPQEILDNKDDDAALKHAMTVLADPQGFIDRVSALYKRSREKSYDEIVFKDGRVVERVGAPIVAENGLYYGWAWYFRDISDRIKQEQKFKNVVEQAADPILILKGEDLRLEVANQALFDLWHVGSEALNKPFVETLPEMKDQGFVQLLRNVMYTGEPFFGHEVPAVFKRTGGKEDIRYFNFSYQPYRETNGEISGVLVLANDVTGQVLAKQKLVESERNFRNMILQSPVAMCIFKGEEFLVEVANERMFQLMGRKKEDLLHKPLFRALPETKEQGFEEVLENVYKTGERFLANERAVFLVRNGKLETVYVNFVFEPFAEDGGSISGIMVVAIDVTEQVMARKRIEESEIELQRRVQERTIKLDQTNKSLQQFAYAASHDLKAPIRKVNTFIQRLKESLAGRLADEEEHYFVRIETATHRMTTLIDDVLTYSEVTLKSNTFELVDLNEVINLVLADLDLEIEQKNAKVSVGPLFTIQGQHRQLQQVFHNLVSNALKYSKHGFSPEIKIEGKRMIKQETGFLSFLPQGMEYFILDISDNGIGFEQKYADQIFDVFTRLHNDSKYTGTGIGLSIVQKVIENHNGFVNAESKPNEGATFKIYLPITKSGNNNSVV